MKHTQYQDLHTQWLKKTPKRITFCLKIFSHCRRRIFWHTSWSSSSCRSMSAVFGRHMWQIIGHVSCFLSVICRSFLIFLSIEDATCCKDQSLSILTLESSEWNHPKEFKYFTKFYILNSFDMQAVLKSLKDDNNQQVNILIYKRFNLSKVSLKANSPKHMRSFVLLFFSFFFFLDNIFVIIYLLLT